MADAALAYWHDGDYPALLFVTTGSLDDPEALPPAAVVNQEETLSWTSRADLAVTRCNLIPARPAAARAMGSGEWVILPMPGRHAAPRMDATRRTQRCGGR